MRMAPQDFLQTGILQDFLQTGILHDNEFLTWLVYFFQFIEH